MVEISFCALPCLLYEFQEQMSLAFKGFAEWYLSDPIREAGLLQSLYWNWHILAYFELFQAPEFPQFRRNSTWGTVSKYYG